jgi:nucleoside-diphosphate-sugar epimerase
VQTFLITGANGFIGSHLAEKLLKDGKSVRCLVRRTSDLKWLENEKIELVYGELNDPESLRNAVRGVDVVVHLAGKTKAPTEEGYFKANAEGTRNLLEAAAGNAGRLKRFVYVSTQAAAGPSLDGACVRETDLPRPVTPYGASKLKGERAVLSFGDRLPVAVVRPPSVFGPRESDMLKFFKMIKRGLRPMLGWGERLVSLVFIDDLVQGIMLCAEKDRAVGQVFFINTVDRISWKDFGRAAAEAAGKKGIPVIVPMPLFVAAVWANDWICGMFKKETILNRSKIPEFLHRYWICDGSKARNELGYQPREDLGTALRLTMDWYVRQGWL